MKIKKVDDKPMVIHTKQKAKLHTHEPKQAAIKGSNIYTVERDPTKKAATHTKYRKSTVHAEQWKSALGIMNYILLPVSASLIMQVTLPVRLH